jgi:hypothetical protein
MNKFRQLAPGLMLGLLLTFSGLATAQTVAQSGNSKKMDACCCSDSCPMTKDAAMKNHATSTEKHECCCCGDSCAMKKDGAMKNHATSADKHDCCCGDSCATMKKDGAKSGAASAKQECSCCGDSCDLKEMKVKDMKSKPEN